MNLVKFFLKYVILIAAIAMICVTSVLWGKTNYFDDVYSGIYPLCVSIIFVFYSQMYNSSIRLIFHILTFIALTVMSIIILVIEKLNVILIITLVTWPLFVAGCIIAYSMRWFYIGSFIGALVTYADDKSGEA